MTGEAMAKMVGRVAQLSIACVIVTAVALTMSACVGPANGTKSPASTAIESASPADTLKGTRTPDVLPTQSAKGMDTSLNVDKTVAAGSSIDVPIVFEGTSSARVTISASTLGVTASLAGTDLVGGSVSGMTLLQTAPLQNPADGTLHIVNPGTSASTVTIIVGISTSRHLTITPLSQTVNKGDTVSFTVSLNEPSAGEAATAYLVDPSGTKTPITLTPAGSGSWTGRTGATTSGTNKIEAQTSGDRPRYAEAGVDVASGSITIAPGFTEKLVDTDNDGLANSLRLTITVTADAPGDYVLGSTLVSSTGQEVDPGGMDLKLVAGTQQVSIDFVGEAIYNSGISGPYRLTDFSLTRLPDGAVEAAAADLGTTQAYDYKVFQH
jgi:hypothetical protein